MDTARQVLRYSIPGSIFLLHGTVCYFIYRHLQGVPFVDSSTTVKESSGAIIAILATIPIGFVIYQIYYSTYKPVLRFLPLKWDGRLVRRDRGAQILTTLDDDQRGKLEEIFGHPIESEQPHVRVPVVEDWRRHPLKSLAHRTGMVELTPELQQIAPEKTRQATYENLWYTNWDVLRATLDVAATSEKSAEIKKEYTTLSDIYHSLGAARTAVSSAFICQVALALTHPGRIWDKPLASFAGLLVAGALTALLWALFHSARGWTWRSAAGTLQYGLRWLFWHRGGDLKEPLRD